MKTTVVALACLLLAVSVCNPAGAGKDVRASSNDVAECDDCKWLVSTSEAYLSNPANQQLLVQFVVTSVCPQLQDPLRQECLDYAPILVPTAVLWIKTNLDPATVCTDLAMCSAEAPRSLHSSILKELKQEDGFPCPVCMFMLTQVVAQIQDPANQAAIEQGALQMCSLLEAPYQPDCHNNIEDITRKAFAVLADVSVEKACQALDACEPYSLLKQLATSGLLADKRVQKLLKGVRHLAVQRAAPNDEAQCEECQMVAAEIKSLLENPDTRRQIKEGLKAACGVLQVYEATCNESVDDYADLVFTMALQYVENPSAVCAQLGYCGASALSVGEQASTAAF